MTIPKRIFASLSLILLCLGLAQTSYADTIVVPNANTNTEGNDGLGSNTLLRLQQVFASSQFVAAGGPIIITQIAVRIDGFGSGFTYTNPNLQINLSTTGMAPDGLSAAFASNVGADDTVVRNGSITTSSANTGPPGGPKDFDVVMTFTTPFLYDPALGNLLIDLRSTGWLFGPAFFDTQETVGDSVSTLDGNLNSPTGSGFTRGFITQFTFTPTAPRPVPEPTTLLLLGSGLVGIAAKVRRNRKPRNRVEE